MAWYHRLRNLIRRTEVDREIDRELSFHIGERVDDLTASGVSEEEAHRIARRQFGNRALQKERTRDMKIPGWIESFGQDLRYAIRTYRRSPASTMVALVSLALGIGANVAVFSLLDAILLRKLPVQSPEQLVSIDWGQKSENAEPVTLSFPLYRDMRERQAVFTDIFAAGFLISNFQTGTRITAYTESGQVTVLDNMLVASVTASYFNVLGLQPAMGRFFAPEDDQVPNSSETTGSVVVLSDGLWERQFGRDPRVLGQTLLIGRSRCRIIGVAPLGFSGITVGSAPDVWVPVVPFNSAETGELLESRTYSVMRYIARLKPGVSRDQAEAAMTALYRQLLAAEGRTRTIEDNYIQLTSVQTGTSSAGMEGAPSFLRETYTTPLWIAMGIVMLVHLIACANVANLLLARGAARRREIGIRIAIGCSRARLIRQLLTESVILSVLGAAAGVLLAYWGSLSLVRMIDPSRELQLHLGPDWRIVMFLATNAVLTGFGFGWLPALRTTRSTVGQAIKGAGRGDAAGVHGQRSSRVVVALQVALSLLLVITAGLLIETIYNLQRLDKGFRGDNVVLFELVDTNSRSRTQELLLQLARDVPKRIQNLPRVRAASVSAPIPIFSAGNFATRVTIPEFGTQEVRFLSVSPGYVEILGIDLLQGRGIEETDTESAPSIAVINEAMQRRFFPGGALGKKMYPGFGTSRQPIEIVGVVRDSKYNSLRETKTEPMLYQPIRQGPVNVHSLLVQTREPLSAITPSVRQALLEVNRDLMIRRVTTVSDQVAQSFSAERMIMRLCVYFSVLALLLACIGLYGIMSYAVTQRRSEIGIRMALGATGKSILRLVLGESFVVVMAGVVIGLALAWTSTRLIASYLYGVTATDPSTIALGTLLLLATASLAAFIPARHASRVDPAIALRQE